VGQHKVGVKEEATLTRDRVQMIGLLKLETAAGAAPKGVRDRAGPATDNQQFPQPK
jgi:hypothetical protein